MLKPAQIEGIREAAGKIGEDLSDAIFSEVMRRLAQLDPKEIRTKRQLQQTVSRLLIDVRKGKAAAVKTAQTDAKKLIKSADKVSIIQDGGGEFQKECEEIIKTAQKEAVTALEQIAAHAEYETDRLPWQLEEAFYRTAEKMVRETWDEEKSWYEAYKDGTKELISRGIVCIKRSPVKSKDENGKEFEEPQSPVSIEAATRQMLLSTLGTMQEKIEHQMADLLGTDGWEITAHACSAPDHEPIQGKQYSNEEYEQLNDSLVRRIGTLNCGHAAFPIMLGQPPQYTEEELQKFRDDNAKGVEINGTHYTGYEATQKQREYERKIRRQKRKVLAAERSGDAAQEQQARTKLRALQKEYRTFSKAAGLRQQDERTWIPEREVLEAERAAAFRREVMGV